MRMERAGQNMQHAPVVQAAPAPANQSSSAVHVEVGAVLADPAVVKQNADGAVAMAYPQHVPEPSGPISSLTGWIRFSTSWKSKNNFRDLEFTIVDLFFFFFSAVKIKIVFFIGLREPAAPEDPADFRAWSSEHACRQNNFQEDADRMDDNLGNMFPREVRFYDNQQVLSARTLCVEGIHARAHMEYVDCIPLARDTAENRFQPAEAEQFYQFIFKTDQGDLYATEKLRFSQLQYEMDPDAEVRKFKTKQNIYEN